MPEAAGFPGRPLSLQGSCFGLGPGPEGDLQPGQCRLKLPTGRLAVSGGHTLWLDRLHIEGPCQFRAALSASGPGSAAYVTRVTFSGGYEPCAAASVADGAVLYGEGVRFREPGRVCGYAVNVTGASFVTLVGAAVDVPAGNSGGGAVAPVCLHSVASAAPALQLEGTVLEAGAGELAPVVATGAGARVVSDVAMVWLDSSSQSLIEATTDAAGIPFPSASDERLQSLRQAHAAAFGGAAAPAVASAAPAADTEEVPTDSDYGSAEVTAAAPSGAPRPPPATPDRTDGSGALAGGATGTTGAAGGPGGPGGVTLGDGPGAGAGGVSAATVAQPASRAPAEAEESGVDTKAVVAGLVAAVAVVTLVLAGFFSARHRVRSRGGGPSAGARDAGPLRGGWQGRAAGTALPRPWRHLLGRRGTPTPYAQYPVALSETVTMPMAMPKAAHLAFAAPASASAAVLQPQALRHTPLEGSVPLAKAVPPLRGVAGRERADVHSLLQRSFRDGKMAAATKLPACLRACPVTKRAYSARRADTPHFTPCGHSLSRAGLARVLADERRCPVCTTKLPYSSIDAFPLHYYVLAALGLLRNVRVSPQGASSGRPSAGGAPSEGRSTAVQQQHGADSLRQRGGGAVAESASRRPELACPDVLTAGPSAGEGAGSAGVGAGGRGGRGRGWVRGRGAPQACAEGVSRAVDVADAAAAAAAAPAKPVEMSKLYLAIAPGDVCVLRPNSKGRGRNSGESGVGSPGAEPGTLGAGQQNNSSISLGGSGLDETLYAPCADRASRSLGTDTTAVPVLRGGGGMGSWPSDADAPVARRPLMGDLFSASEHASGAAAGPNEAPDWLDGEDGDASCDGDGAPFELFLNEVEIPQSLGLVLALQEPTPRIEWAELSLAAAWPQGPHDFLGCGATAVVFRAVWRGADVAVKLRLEQKFESDEDLVQLTFHREHQIASALDSDFIVRCHGEGRMSEGELAEAAAAARVHLGGDAVLAGDFIVFECVCGGSLAAVIHRGPAACGAAGGTSALPVGEAARIAACVSAALCEFHPDIAHNDVKPENILVAGPAAGGGRATYKLADFGLAWSMRQHHQLRRGVGTAAYLSPEVLYEHAAADARNDVYALGVTVWECVTGVEPRVRLRGVRLSGPRGCGTAVDCPADVDGAGAPSARLPVPSACPAHLERLLSACWEPSETRILAPQARERAEAIVAGQAGIAPGGHALLATFAPSELLALHAEDQGQSDEAWWGAGDCDDCAMVDLCKLIEQHTGDDMS